MDNTTSQTSLEVLLKRGQMALEEHNFRDASAFFEQALSIDPESGTAYIGLAMAKANVISKTEFMFYCIEQSGKDNAVLRRARQFADSEWAEFFSRVDAEAEQNRKENADYWKSIKKVFIGIAIIIGLLAVYRMALPNFLYIPAEKLYDDERYKQAYKKAHEIADNTPGSAHYKGKIEKYAYAYLLEHLSENGDLQTTLSDGGTVIVRAGSDGAINFMYSQESKKYQLVWIAQAINLSDEVNCTFYESIYTSNSKKSIYTEHGDFTKSDYEDYYAIDCQRSSGFPQYSDWYALREYGEIAIAEALALIKAELGIPAEHLGFYLYR